MKDVFDFASKMAPITFKEDIKAFGMYPFPLFAEGSDGQTTLSALLLNSVIPCFANFREHKIGGAKRVYMALDYPAMTDIKNDFVVVFSYENNQLTGFAIPYDNQSGEVFEPITESEILGRIINSLSRVLNM